MGEGLEPLHGEAQKHVPLPKRPRPRSQTIVSFLLFVRLEVFLAESRKTQCSIPGVEPKPGAKDESDPWGDFFLDVVNWITASRITLVISVILLSLGVRDAVSQITRTSFFCASTVDSRTETFLLQGLGMCLDAAILILLWRIISHTKSTQGRLQALSSILQTTSYLAVGIFVFGVVYAKQSFWSMYVSDILQDGILLSVVLITSTVLMCESTPIVPAATILMALGQVASLENVDRMQIWLHGTAFGTLKPLYFLFFGYSLLLSRHHMAMLKTMVKLSLFCSLAVIIFTALPISLIRAGKHELHMHPLNKLIYEARIQSDGWVTRASISGSLHVAALEYQDRNGGRLPPPGFDGWYYFAKEKRSVIIDDFAQIGNDILPFWNVSPKTLRERIEQLNEQPGIAMVRIRGGKAFTTSTRGDHASKPIDELVSMISVFSKHLPDMDIPVNLYDQPRVLSTHGRTSDIWASTSISERQHMESLGCPLGSSVRSREPWNIRDFTTKYISSYSKWQFITDWEGALDTCNQPDVRFLHGFHMMPPANHEPYVQLMPVFSRSKTGGFSDILIPLPANHDSEDESIGNFNGKETNLYWRGGYGDPTVGQQGLRGNHKHRLAHLVNNATSQDETLVVLPTPHNSERFAYARVPTQDLNALLPMDIAFSTDSSPHTCLAKACTAARLELGAKKPQPGLLDHRYVLVLDTDSGPSSVPTAFAAMKSSAVPFISTIFTHWYSERVMPWVHFVPVNLRLTDFHSTLSYFTGLQRQHGADHDGNRDGKHQDPDVAAVTLDGRKVTLRGAMDDASWIASQGKAWAKKALRREDMEVYLYRLLLEWARVIDDRRDELAFVYKSN
ncbi:hypothetical protein jhhlp_000934 [Lomentospora prolificans]|uniref:Glycosyl transferase CAP10 domain-containing protein n=1 Tax=Lomentospora prolificans TaxID=41688 RepID=A0A2N3NJV0_9PEZI|nr:hypothetical protein jhhlp_000934 [Lomentospora prolificans]